MIARKGLNRLERSTEVSSCSRHVVEPEQPFNCHHSSPYTSSMAPNPDLTTEVLVPIKSFTDAKRRLAHKFDPHQREMLARSMALRVLSAAQPFPVSVVCDDDEVATFAVDSGATVIWCPVIGLNEAVTAGVGALRDRGVTQVVVSHADLPFANSFSELVGWDGVTLVPDRHRRGTNVAVVDTRCGFQWSYGEGSLARHRAEALRLGLPLRITQIGALAWDVDLPADLTDGPDGISAVDLVPAATA